ncbi:ATP-grasp domain-containing protein [Streptomyces sp. NBC_01601]|uniref:ATP-grasp domain-containing protein n=1 Tax=Streptomyces sp. NBC_01601 TaxID=2975892 RepID=UPI002E2CF831|nr:ATP-grasp domain-containing protein [Streptomyces sp. NBC_01601]
MTIVIVDGYSTGAALARRLHNLGVDCLHVQSQPYVNGFLQHSFDRSHYAHDFGYTADQDTLVKQLEQHRVTRVIAGTESGVTVSETLALRLHLPTNTPGLRAARRDKNLMARAASAAGLATPLATVASTPDEAARWFGESALSEVVVKPMASAGTDNVRFCRTVGEVWDATTAILTARTVFGEANHAALIQERLIGDEYYINTVSHDGHHRVAEMWRYTKQVGPAGGPIYDYEEPVAADTPEARALREFTFAVLDALGIRATPAHTEVMITERGPVLIEAGARLGGATAPDIVEHYCGVSQTGLTASALIAPETLLSFDDQHATWSCAVRNVEFVNHHHGTADPEAAARIAELPSVVAVFPAVDSDANLQPTVDLLSSPGYAYLAAASRDEIERDYTLLRTWEHAGLHTGGQCPTAAARVA